MGSAMGYDEAYSTVGLLATWIFFVPTLILYLAEFGIAGQYGTNPSCNPLMGFQIWLLISASVGIILLFTMVAKICCVSTRINRSGCGIGTNILGLFVTVLNFLWFITGGVMYWNMCNKQTGSEHVDTMMWFSLVLGIVETVVYFIFFCMSFNKITS